MLGKSKLIFHFCFCFLFFWNKLIFCIVLLIVLFKVAKYNAFCDKKLEKSFDGCLQCFTDPCKMFSNNSSKNYGSSYTEGTKSSNQTKWFLHASIA